jgi:O-methyltransferase involved in polyketide biosynthesis
MEGLLMYLPPEIVDGIFSFIAHNSCNGSAIVFDYIPSSVVEGTCELEAGKNWRKGVMDAGEPFLFGIEAGTLKTFLARRGFAQIRDMTSENYRNTYLHGKNAGRQLNPLLMFAYAVVE